MLLIRRQEATGKTWFLVSLHGIPEWLESGNQGATWTTNLKSATDYASESYEWVKLVMYQLRCINPKCSVESIHY